MKISLIPILFFRLCHGSHDCVPSPGERILIQNPEKYKPRKWEPASGSESDDGESEKSPPINKLKFGYYRSKSRRPRIIVTTTAMKPCESDNPHIDWDPTIHNTENWDLIDVVSV